MIVLDSSAVVDYLLGSEPRASWVRGRMADSGWHLRAPHCMDVEVAAVLRRHVRARLISAELGGALIDVLVRLRIVRYPHVQLLARAWELRAHVTAADAMFVALAEALDAPLVTTDAALARAHGIAARIDAFAG